MERDPAEPDNILPFNLFERRGEELINGVRMKLGRMGLGQLVELERACRSRVLDAQTDLWIVQDYKHRRFPTGGDAG